MSKLVMMKGLPASGKTTKAKELVAEGNTVRVNKDLLRKMLHFDKFTGKNEGITRDVEKLIAKELLSRNLRVIVDDTNLSQGHHDYWCNVAKETGSSFEVMEILETPHTCILRDSKREDGVGAHVIVGMAMQYYDLYADKNIVICDIDGTIANIDHRLHYVSGEKKDWKSFFEHASEDAYREDVIDMVLEEKVKHSTDTTTARLFFVSGRPETYRKETEQWISNSHKFGEWFLFMRGANDSRPDTEVKREIYGKYFSKTSVVKVFDDRPRVIRMWKKLGLDVVDVGKGIEF
jgi:tRNA uridine 5-carbamoylmethylation protein Kti12